MLFSLFLLSTLIPTQAEQGQKQSTEAVQDAPQYMGRAFLFEIDVDAARKHGWVASDVAEADVLERVRASLHERLKSSGKFVEARPVSEPEAKISVTFVGRMARGIEDMLAEGLSRPGHLELVSLADDADLDGTTLGEERARLDAWLTATGPAVDTGAKPDLTAFATLSREAGGPWSGLRWVPLSDASSDPGASSAYVPILAEGGMMIRRADVGKIGLERVEIEGRRRAAWELGLVPGEALASKLALLPERLSGGWCYLVDGEATAPASPELASGALRIDFARGLGDLRSFVLSFAGEPLCAPVRFVGFDKRPLSNVVIHVPGDDD